MKPTSLKKASQVICLLTDSAMARSIEEENSDKKTPVAQFATGVLNQSKVQIKEPI